MKGTEQLSKKAAQFRESPFFSYVFPVVMLLMPVSSGKAALSPVRFQSPL